MLGGTAEARKRFYSARESAGGQKYNILEREQYYYISTMKDSSNK
jgi:hypothetical protein